MSFRISFHDFLVIRTPLLPFNITQNLSEEALQELFQTPLLLEAVCIASPDLSTVVREWLDGAPITKKNSARLLLTLRKYLLRMAFRCTPYGLFAGISRGKWGEVTTLKLASRTSYVRHSRIDMDYLCMLAASLIKEKPVRENLLYYNNNTIYEVGNNYRYIEYNFRNKTRQHELVTVTNSEFLTSVLQQARTGQSLDRLVESLVSEDISLNEAQQFLAEVVDSQVLISELEPVVTGKDYLLQLKQVLQTHCEGHSVLDYLGWLHQKLTSLDKTFLGNTLAPYQEIVAEATRQGVDFKANQLLQVDMLKPTQGDMLNRSVQAELGQAISLLHGLGGPAENEALQRFRVTFRERYEEQEVPLLQVLDIEMGIGYPVGQQDMVDPAPLLHDLPLNNLVTDGANGRWTGWQEFLFEKYLRVVNGQDENIILQDAEVEPFKNGSTPPLPTSLYSMGCVLAASAQALDNGEFQVVHYFTTGPSAARLLARFCHLDEGLTADVQAALTLEEAQDPTAVFAEIVHLSQSRIGNVSKRPVLRAYEIPILGQAGVDEAHTIPLSDLFISLQGDHIVLRSASLNRRVIPRLSSADNYALHNLPVYHFLCALQFQNVSYSTKWDWGPLQHAAFLPRVIYRKVILSEAKWQLSKSEIEQFSQVAECGLLEAAGQMRQRRGLPNWVVVADDDNKLPIRLDSLPHLQVLQSLLKHKEEVIVEECLFNSGNLAVEGPEGAFTNEFIFPLSSTPASTAEPSTTSALRKKQVVSVQPFLRTFSVGSEWLYIKLYCGLQTADQLLVEVILPLVQRLRNEGLIDKWFFIRYRDTQSHLRVRFHGTGNFYGQVIEALHEALHPYRQANLLFSLSTDTYQRELERYGTQNIVHSETLFECDSDATIKLIALLEGQEGDRIRWLLALRSIDTLLTDFGRSLEEKMNLMRTLQYGFKLEMRITSAAAKKAFGTKYREVRSQIEQVLNPLPSSDNELALAIAILAERSEKWAPTISAILSQEREGILEISLDRLLEHYIHMLVNRFFRAKQRKHEAVIYDFLFQHYVSLWARRTGPNN